MTQAGAMDPRARILVVDDEDLQLRAASRLLRQAGYEVLETMSGEEALRQVRETGPDLVLLDVVLSDTDGLEVCRRIKADPDLANSSVLLVSGLRTDAKSLADGLEGGADGYLIRPISNDELLARVQALLRVKQAEEALRARTKELEERVKELNCLYGMSRLVEQVGTSLEDILLGTLALIPRAWQYPEITCARIVLGEEEYRTDNHRETPWRQSAGILVHGEAVGKVEVGYLERRPVAGQWLFLKGEQELLGAIAERLGRIVERLRAEEALNRGQERYMLAQRAANIGSWDWDIRTGQLFWSEQIEPMFGFGPGQFGATYEAFLACVHPEDRQRVMDAVDASVERDADYAIEHRIVWPDGTVRWVSETGDVIRDTRGTAIRMLGVVQDVTDRRRAERALRESETKYRQLIESLQEGIWVLDKDARTTFVNPRMATMLGYTVDEMLGRHLFEFMDQQQVQIAQHNLERRSQGIAERHDFEFLRKDGSRIYTSLETAPLTDEGGNLLGALAGVMDVTDRRLAEEALREANKATEAARREEQARRQEAEQRRRVAEALRGVLTVLNSNRSLDEVLDYIAGQAGGLLGTRAAGIYALDKGTGGLSVKAVRGLLATYVTGARIPIGRGALRQAMDSRQPVAVPDLSAALADGSGLLHGPEELAAAGAWARIYRALIAVPIVIQGQIYGGILLYYGQPRSFSEEEIELAVAFGDQVALAIANSRLREEVERAATTAERDRLARELHDAVTQTLFSASLIAEAMPRVWEHNPDYGRRGLEELRRLTRGAAAEMRTLLVELRPAALTEKPLGELLRHLTEATSGRARVPIELAVEGDGVLPPDVQIALYRIVQEALNNVAKHAGASRVAVALRCQPHEADLFVHDNGCGFDLAAILPDRFGLGIMRERAQEIGAIMDVDSQPGQGTQVSVTWRGATRR